MDQLLGSSFFPFEHPPIIHGLIEFYRRYNGMSRTDLRIFKKDFDFCSYGSGYLNTVFSPSPTTLGRNFRRRHRDHCVVNLPFLSLHPNAFVQRRFLCSAGCSKVVLMNEPRDSLCVFMTEGRLVCIAAPSLEMPDSRRKKTAILLVMTMF